MHYFLSQIITDDGKITILIYNVNFEVYEIIVRTQIARMLS